MKHCSKCLSDRVRDTIRLKGYSVRTEEAYADWIKRFVLFHDKRHPQEMGYSDVRAFLLRLSALVPEGVASESILPGMGRPRDVTRSSAPGRANAFIRLLGLDCQIQAKGRPNSPNLVCSAAGSGDPAGAESVWNYKCVRPGTLLNPIIVNPITLKSYFVHHCLISSTHS